MIIIPSECVKNESQGQESQGRTDNNDFVRWVHDV